MTAVDEIQAAIKRLNNVKTVLGHAVDSDEEVNGSIVTLHATIDAQLAILREGLEQAEITVSPDEDDEIAIFLTLARAINGAS